MKRGTQYRVEIGRVQHQQGTLHSAVQGGNGERRAGCTAQCGVERGRGEVVAFYNLPGRPLGEEPTTSRVLTKH